MKKMFFLIFISFHFCVMGQNKKELNERIDILETKMQSVENELGSLKTIIAATSTTINLLSQYNTSLEKQLDGVITKYATLQKLYDSLQQKIIILASVKVKEEPVSRFEAPPVTTGDSIRYLVHNFMTSRTINEKKQYVLYPEKMEPFMQIFYDQGVGYNNVKYDEIRLKDSLYIKGQIFTVGLWDKLIYCVRTNEGFRVDWPSTAGFNKVNLRTFQVGIDIDEAVVRVVATLSNYYNYNYIGHESDFLNISIQDSKRNNINGCYVERSSEAGKKIYNILKDGNSHQMIIQIQKDLTNNKRGDVVRVTKFLYNGWYGIQD